MISTVHSSTNLGGAPVAPSNRAEPSALPVDEDESALVVVGRSIGDSLNNRMLATG